MQEDFIGNSGFTNSNFLQSDFIKELFGDFPRKHDTIGTIHQIHRKQAASIVILYELQHFFEVLSKKPNNIFTKLIKKRIFYRKWQVKQPHIPEIHHENPALHLSRQHEILFSELQNKGKSSQKCIDLNILHIYSVNTHENQRSEGTVAAMQINEPRLQEIRDFLRILRWEVGFSEREVLNQGFRSVFEFIVVRLQKPQQFAVGETSLLVYS